MQPFKKYRELLLKYFWQEQIDELKKYWNEEHRYFHNEEHLSNILQLIENEYSPDDKNFDILVIIAFFHDVIYNPKESSTNENKSVKFLKNYISDLIKHNENNLMNEHSCLIYDAILNTKYLPPYSNHSVLKKFWDFDNNILTKSFGELIKYENKIFKEFQFLDYKDYKIKRIEFLNKAYDYFKNEDLLKLIEYIENRQINIGIYPGSFNPFHIGHLNILKKSENIFDKVIIGFGINPEKENNNIKIVPKRLDLRHTELYDILLPDFIQNLKNKNSNANITLIRGLRNEYDLNYESNQLQFIKDYDSSINICTILCDKEYEHISSSSIRQLENFNQSFVSKYIVK